MRRGHIATISFAAIIPEFAPHGYYVGTKVSKVDFKLGLGPCKETVEHLEITESIAWVTIQQRTEVGVKVFQYRTQDIVGRIMVEHTI